MGASRVTRVKGGERGHFSSACGFRSTMSLYVSFRDPKLFEILNEMF